MRPKESVGQLKFNVSAMSVFPVTAPPTPQKLRGGYYTPAPIARFLAEWVAEAGPRLLEPSCGDGSVLSALPARSRAAGVEIEPDEARKAADAAPFADVIVDDFFNWFTPDQWARWDGVAGNPPFVRFGNWSEPMRGRALDVMRQVDLRPTKLTNAWVPFVVAGTLALRIGGRLALVLPAELLQVKYAADLRAFLVDRFSDLTAVAFRRLVFDGILQEVILLLGTRGDGPAAIRVTEVENAEALPSPRALAALPHVPALQHEAEKWTKYFLEPKGIETLRHVQGTGLGRLGEVADVDVGVVTGRNQFFVLRPSAAAQHGIQPHLVPLVSKSAHLRGVRFANEDLAALRADDALCELLAVSEATDIADDDPLTHYISAGEAADVHKGYKCSIRKSWWAVPSMWTPDAFLLRQIHDHPRIIANMTAATSTDTIHRIRMLNGLPATKLAAASINSVTFAFSEVMGRSYGGGVLELEPREAEALPFPDARRLTMRDVTKIDRIVRSGDLEAALDYVDATLFSHIDPELLIELRRVWERLRDRRLARGRKAAPAKPVVLAATQA